MSAKRIDVVRRDDHTVSLEVTYSDGTAYDLTGSTVYFTVKANLTDTDANAKIQKTVTSHSDPANGITSITLSKTDTNIDAGDYYWDLQIKESGGDIHSVRYGIFRIIQDITITTS